MTGKLLCWLGMHDWEVEYLSPWRAWGTHLIPAKACRRCGKHEAEENPA